MYPLPRLSAIWNHVVLIAPALLYLIEPHYLRLPSLYQIISSVLEKVNRSLSIRIQEIRSEIDYLDGLFTIAGDSEVE